MKLLRPFISVKRNLQSAVLIQRHRRRLQWQSGAGSNNAQGTAVSYLFAAYLTTAIFLKMGRIGCTETWVPNYLPTPSNTPEERKATRARWKPEPSHFHLSSYREIERCFIGLRIRTAAGSTTCQYRADEDFTPVRYIA